MPESKILNRISAAGQRETWRSLSKALGAELLDVHTITGASGLDHPIQALARSEVAGSIIVVSADANARVAALMQADIQAAMPETKVIVSRPLIIDLSIVMQRILAPLGSATPALDELKIVSEAYSAKSPEVRQAELLSYLASAFGSVAWSFKNLSLSTTNQIVDVVNQASALDWKQIGERIKAGTNEKQLDLSPLWHMDNTATDRQYGVCPLPLYEFTESDWDLMLDPRRTEDLTERLRELGVLQFFYPPPDQLALALIDNGVTDRRDVLRVIEATPQLGHPHAGAELLSDLPPLGELASALKDAGYILEAEYELEVAQPNGAITRGKVKVRPREALVARLLRGLNINFHLHTG